MDNATFLILRIWAIGVWWMFVGVMQRGWICSRRIFCLIFRGLMVNVFKMKNFCEIKNWSVFFWYGFFSLLEVYYHVRYCFVNVLHFPNNWIIFFPIIVQLTVFSHYKRKFAKLSKYMLRNNKKWLNWSDNIRRLETTNKFPELAGVVVSWMLYMKNSTCFYITTPTIQLWEKK